MFLLRRESMVGLVAATTAVFAASMYKHSKSAYVCYTHTRDTSILDFHTAKCAGLTQNQRLRAWGGLVLVRPRNPWLGVGGWLAGRELGG
ncbi:hypothetical protein LZ30DRAFT_705882 [Colletotrichum cereale]|nr:hypothetical protein LZ30DRAFT_705882 [Colletotrichum cereale]